MVGQSPRAQILLTALLFSTGGAAIKAATLSSWQIASFRSGLAAIVLLLGARHLRGFSRATLLVGVAYAATLTSFVVANRLTTAANSVFLQATAPLYIALLGPWALGEFMRRRDVPIVITIAIGIVMLFLGSQDVSLTAPDRATGNLVGLFSGCCWALTVMGLRWVEKRDPAGPDGPARAAAITGNLIACVACLPFALPVTHIALHDGLVVGYLGIFQVGLAYLLLTRAIKHVPAVDASLLLLAEPAFSPLWAWLFQNESPGGWPLAGGALIIGAATLKTWQDARRAESGA